MITEIDKPVYMQVLYAKMPNFSEEVSTDIKHETSPMEAKNDFVCPYIRTAGVICVYAR